MKSRLIIIRCAGYIFWRLFLRRLQYSYPHRNSYDPIRQDMEGVYLTARVSGEVPLSKYNLGGNSPDQRVDCGV